jgi:translocon-associated protein subunit alpha
MALPWKYLILILGLSLVFTVSRVTAEDGDDDETVEAEGEGHGEGSENVEETEETPKLTSSTEAETSILFVKPVIPPEANVELPAGKMVEIIVGFHNKANYDFVVDTLDASFRFPMDFNYHMQNFTAVAYDYTVKPGQHGSILYAFIPHEAFGSRSYGLAVQLTYHDLNGNYYRDAVFNQTVPIVELDEGLDGETFFLYVFLAGFLVLLMVLGHQFLSWGKKKTIGSSKSSKPKAAVETGTKQAEDVDFDWIPKETLQDMKRSPKTPTRSPRARKARKASPADDE